MSRVSWFGALGGLALAGLCCLVLRTVMASLPVASLNFDKPASVALPVLFLVGLAVSGIAAAFWLVCEVQMRKVQPR